MCILIYFVLDEYLCASFFSLGVIFSLLSYFFLNICLSLHIFVSLGKS